MESHHNKSHRINKLSRYFDDHDLGELTEHGISLFYFDTEKEYRDATTAYLKTENLLGNFSSFSSFIGPGWYNMKIETEPSYHGEAERLKPEHISETLSRWKNVQECANETVLFLEKVEKINGQESE